TRAFAPAPPFHVSSLLGSRLARITSCPCSRKPSAKICPTCPEPNTPILLMLRTSEAHPKARSLRQPVHSMHAHDEGFSSARRRRPEPPGRARGPLANAEHDAHRAPARTDPVGGQPFARATAGDAGRSAADPRGR